MRDSSSMLLLDKEFVPLPGQGQLHTTALVPYAAGALALSLPVAAALSQR